MSEGQPDKLHEKESSRSLSLGRDSSRSKAASNVSISRAIDQAAAGHVHSANSLPPFQPSPWQSEDPTPLEDAIEAIFHFPERTKRRRRREGGADQDLVAAKRERVSPAPAWSMKQAASPSAMQVHAGTSSASVTARSAPSLSTGNWTEEEHQKFLAALREYCPDAERAGSGAGAGAGAGDRTGAGAGAGDRTGAGAGAGDRTGAGAGAGARAVEGRKNVGLGKGVAYLISRAVGTRTESQVRSHAQKYFQNQQKR
ncbi:hypothetical protein GUITHDRAFT_122904 [Guillardia theta CCMP2712]|uniref:Myb-like domain-containing protein n=1 Tax=Guillardia theta (strain CCMP2712) TaxID=905079 RepID=L1I4W8_GUITC|nr:hypothetical protein GUITHDRAFT_122904 [Guillardia theta CCMP2712]EKX30890.1 hypothetical protein GUITHDRAFT_122904 [Guillardia theta CCMP2712]|eukprot:XP_005817870.1 hypothetical protein GUITHDRAFT_122904 [Guillardia theta CCMP2712]